MGGQVRSYYRDKYACYFFSNFSDSYKHMDNKREKPEK